MTKTTIAKIKKGEFFKLSESDTVQRLKTFSDTPTVTKS